MTNAQDAYRRMLRDHLSPALRTLGFKGSGGRYELPSETHWLLLGFQKSAFSDSEAVRFTVNCKVVDKAAWASHVARETWLPKKPTPSDFTGGPEWLARLGELMQEVEEDKWWVLSAEQDPSCVASEVADAIRTAAMPAMLAASQEPITPHTRDDVEGAVDNLIVAAREDIAEDLWLYGEEELAEAMIDSDDATYRRVMVTAFEPEQQKGRAGSLLIAESLALAAVEVLTGEPRPLARKRRRPGKALDELWRRVGQDRDKRGEGDWLASALELADGN